jgi:hypothetical protein
MTAKEITDMLRRAPTHLGEASDQSLMSVSKHGRSWAWKVYSWPVSCRPKGTSMQDVETDLSGSFDARGRFREASAHLRRTNIDGRPARARTLIRIAAQRTPSGGLRGTFRRRDAFISHGKVRFRCEREAHFALKARPGAPLPPGP